MELYRNNSREDLYCIECKEKIELFQQYVIDYEIYSGETIEKYYHVPCFPIREEDFYENY